MKQTAVEWFNDEILIYLNFDQRLYLKNIFKQAKELEKQQIINAYLDGNYDNEVGRCKEEKYYNAKFKNK